MFQPLAQYQHVTKYKYIVANFWALKHRIYDEQGQRSAYTLVVSASSRNSLLQFTRIATMNKEIHNDIFRRLSDTITRKSPEKWRTSIWFLLHDNAPAHRSVWVNDFLAKNNVTILQQPHTLLTWLQLIFNCSLDWNQHWREGAFVMLTTSFRMRRKSWKGSHKTAFSNVSNTLTVAGKNVRLHKWTILKEM